jgi:hypothetical protein
MGGQFYKDNGPSTHQPWRLWPGESKPGIWMSTMSKMGQLVKTCSETASARSASGKGSPSSSSGGGENKYKHGDDDDDDDDDGTFNVPPVFDSCSQIISPQQEIAARDLYWEVTCRGGAPPNTKEADMLLAKLQEAIKLNPFIAEPHILSAQLLSDKGDFHNALLSAEVGLKLLCAWGTPWDKRMGWAAWVAWSRMLAQRAESKLEWPKETWGVMNLGLVHQN